MKESGKLNMDQLKSEYLKLVQSGLHLQKAGDLNAFTKNAIKAELVAQKIQGLARSVQ